ncbi:MAG: TraB/GumN family protein [Steroidobacteraceae bacterium]|nr:TraB/GumN family protein [Steroidobacteraceae bacterium]
MTFSDALRRGLTHGLASLTVLVLATGQTEARGESSVWTLKGKTNTVYLAGSVHALPKEHSEFPPALERAYAAADAIVMEVDLDDLDPLEAVQFITTKGTLPAGQTLEQIVGKKYSSVAALADSLEVPEVAIAKLEPWAAAMVLTQFALMKSGFEAELGIDMQLVGRARADGKKIDGLETVVDQLSVFDDRSFAEQTQFLLDSTEDAPELPDDLDRLVAAWRTGDLAALEKEFLKERARTPALYDALLGARNRKWVPQIEALLDDDRDYLVVVGALHFVGDDGLIALLGKAGHPALPLASEPATPSPR